jgi:hypothetical protein
MKLDPFMTLETAGARAVTPFYISGALYVALPQLAEDVLAAPPNMNGGNSQTHTHIFIWKSGTFEHFQSLPVQGGEDVAFGVVDGIPMLAVANIRSGTTPHFNTHVDSQVFAWNGRAFQLKQSIPTFAAKGACLFRVNGQHFLGISQGVKESSLDDQHDMNAQIFLWNGESFEWFQTLPGCWGYNLSYFEMNGEHYLTVPDQLGPSQLYVWKGTQFELLQGFGPSGGGRKCCYFISEGQHYLAFANLLHNSELYRWSGHAFDMIQTFEGIGGRNFHFHRMNGKDYLFRTNFITGTREAPISKQLSQVYVRQGEQFEEIATYTTFGGTDAATVEADGMTFLVVSNSLTEDIRFNVPSQVYRIL